MGGSKAFCFERCYLMNKTLGILSLLFSLSSSTAALANCSIQNTLGGVIGTVDGNQILNPLGGLIGTVSGDQVLNPLGGVIGTVNGNQILNPLGGLIGTVSGNQVLNPLGGLVGMSSACNNNQAAAGALIFLFSNSWH
jgi:hypothetical protein